jgi:hypothetical protein
VKVPLGLFLHLLQIDDLHAFQTTSWILQQHFQDRWNCFPQFEDSSAQISKAFTNACTTIPKPSWHLTHATTICHIQSFLEQLRCLSCITTKAMVVSMWAFASVLTWRTSSLLKCSFTVKALGLSYKVLDKWDTFPIMLLWGHCFFKVLHCHSF